PGFSNLILSTNGLETEADSIFFKLDRPHEDDWGLSLAYTWTDAEENRIFSETFSLDYPSLEFYGTHPSVGVPEHRLVVTGTYDLPWDILFSGKLTLESDVPFQYTDCLAGDDQCVLRRLEPGDSDLR